MITMSRGSGGQGETARRRALLAKGQALKPPSPGAAPGYPIGSAGEWDKARLAVGRVGSPERRAQLAKLLRKTAPMFGKQQALAGSWAAGGGAGMANYGYQSLLMTESDGYTAGSSTATVTAGGGLQCMSCGAENDGSAKFCDQCGHDMTGATPREKETSGYGTDNASTRPYAPEVLRTPQLGTPRSAGMNPGQVAVGGGRADNKSGYGRGNASLPALANSGQRSVNLARPMPVTRPEDVLISRVGGRAVIRHRSGGIKIGEIYKADRGWVGVRADGTETEPTTQQRAVLFNLIGGYNSGASPLAARTQALQPPPQQTPLMAQYGVPAIRALATPATSYSGGGRVTMANGGDSDGDGDGDGPSGLGPRGMAIYKRLIAKKFPKDRALTFAKNAERRATAGASSGS